MRRLPAAVLAVTVAALAAATLAAAQDVRVNAAFDRRRVMPGEMLTYTITLSAESLPGGRVQSQPDFSAFDVVAGPSSSQSSEIRFVNGAINKRENLTLSWRLVAKKEGVATIPESTLVFGAQRVSVPKADIQVAAGGSAPPQAQPSPGQPPPGQPMDPFEAMRQARARAEGRSAWPQPQPAQRPGEGFSVRTEVADRDVWQGQPIVVRDVLTFNADVATFGEKDAIEFPGFAKKHDDGIKPDPHRVQDPTTGAVTNEATLNQWVIVPLTSGKKTLPAHWYKFSVRSSDPMERMFGREFEVDRAGDPVAIDVRPLPDGAPASFGGAIGSFQLDAKLAATSLKAGDGTQLVVTVRGRGSFEGVTLADLGLPPAIKSFEPEISEHTTFAGDGQIEGSKTFTVPLLVTEAGAHEIAPISWSFFDPQTGRYVERRTAPLHVQAAPGEVPIVASRPVQVTASVDVQGTDIRHVRGSLPKWTPDLAASGLPRWLVAAGALGPLLNVAVALGALVVRLGRRDPAMRRAHEAASVARKRLARAGAALGARRATEAADEAARAIAGIVSDRLGLGAELAPAEAAGAVASAGDPDLARRVEKFLSDCDFARFATAGPADVTRLLAEARHLLPLLAALEPPRRAA